MFERFRKNRGDGYADERARGDVATRERPAGGDSTVADDDRAAARGDGVDGSDRVPVEDRRVAPGAGTTAGAGAASAMTAHDVRARQRGEFGGFNWGAAFFGWLVAIGMATILAAILSAAGAALGFTKNVSTADATANAKTIGIVGAALLLAVLLIAYYAGGYVAGRMSRFDGGRQGLGVWLFGLLVTLAVAALAAIGGSKYNILNTLHLPNIPVKSGDLTRGAAVTFAAVFFGTLLTAFLGGKVGERYHRRIDRAGFLAD